MKLEKKFGKTANQLQKRLGHLQKRIHNETVEAQKEEAKNFEIIEEEYKDDV